MKRNSRRLWWTIVLVCISILPDRLLAASPYRLYLLGSPYTTFSTFTELVAFFTQNGVQNCYGEGWTTCQFNGLTFQAYNGQVAGSFSEPPFGPYSPNNTAVFPHVQACLGPGYCTDDTDGWGVFSTNVCPTGQVWEQFSDGSWKCVPFGDRNEDKPKLCSEPRVGKPIFPLTGVQSHDLPLGINIGSTSLAITYDTRDQLPEANGMLPWLNLPVPSFGSMWQSNVHRSLQLRGASSTPGAAYTGVTVQNGGNNNETFAPSGGIDTCGGTVQGAAGGGYLSTTDAAHQVLFSGATANLIDQSGLSEQIFASDGTLTTTNSAQGGALTYAYSTATSTSAPGTGLLMSVSDQFGRSVQFAYEQPSIGGYAPRITTITGPDGQVTKASYDPVYGNLIGMTWPDLNKETFVYERPDLSWALTGIIDEGNNRYITLGYDAYGRANLSQMGSGVDKFTVQYDPSTTVAPHWQVDETFIESVPVVCRVRHWVTPPQQQLTDPGSQPIIFGATSSQGMPLPSSQSQPAGSGCSASSSAQTYDAASNRISRDDFNGNRSCYAYDLSRNLVTLALEGLPNTTACPSNLVGYTPSAVDAAHPERLTTTAWHPNWALKSQESEPKRITTWVYNGQHDPISGGTASCAPSGATLPDGQPIAVLCAKYEQATSDATGGQGLSATVVGATRAWAYTYNQYGQVLTATTPKQSATDRLSHTTTYTYYSDTSITADVGHTLGDLQSVTNPLGQITTYTLYDGAGRLLSSTDANGTVTTQTYYPRGWLQTQTVTPATGNALTTNYAYWPTGLLQTVTMPDASTLNYAYDTAHRLTDVVDGAGNKLHYVLDNSGNKTSEQVSDASGNLASTVARVFDVLNRVQSMTGAMH